MLKRAASACLTPLALRAARSYIAGPQLADALHVAGGLAEGGFRTTLGFWDGAGDSPASVAQEYLSTIAALAGAEDDCYLSIKLPALGNSSELLDRILTQARGCVADEPFGAQPGYVERAPRRFESNETTPLRGAYSATEGDTYIETPNAIEGVTCAQAPPALRIHFDSLSPETADATWSAAVAAVAAGNAISCSLPGRWRRSIADAEIALEAGIVPRVVKGQWPDSDGHDIDMRVGFISVIRHLAGRAAHVAVASHDVPLAREAIRQLRAAGTNCELELLYGLPQRAAVEMARQEGVPVRFYVPYGRAYLPYCLGQLRRQPGLFWWLLRDALFRA